MPSKPKKPSFQESLSLPFKPLLKRVAIGIALGLGAGCATPRAAGHYEMKMYRELNSLEFTVDNPKNAKIQGIKTVIQELDIDYTDFIKHHQVWVEQVQGNEWRVIYHKRAFAGCPRGGQVFYLVPDGKNRNMEGIQSITSELGMQFSEFRKRYDFNIEQLEGNHWKLTYTLKKRDQKKRKKKPKRQKARQPADTQRARTPERPAQRQVQERMSPAEIEKKEIIREVRKAVFEKINYHRRKHDLQEVTHDPLAEKAAQLYAEEMLRDDVVAHWEADGRLAHHRLSSVGGSDGVWENCSGGWIRGSYQKASKQKLIESALESHDRMYNEQPPDDGHRKNILNPTRTGVGIGFAFAPNGTYFMAQEFVDHYTEMNSVKRRAEVGETITVSGELVNNTTLFSIEVFWEPFPKPMSKAERKATYSYHLPKNRKQLQPKLEGRGFYEDEEGRNIGRGVVEVSGDKKRFKTPVTFDRGPGIYMISVWANHPKFGNIQATHITIDVHKPKRKRTARRKLALK